MDFLKMMGKAKELQSKMDDLQEKIATLHATGSSGGDLVKVTLDGKGGMQNVTIDASLCNGEEVEILEDLIVAAHQDAKTKVEALVQEKTQELMGGLGLPSNFQLPF